MHRRVKIGDIIEIPTAKGLAYAQFTHKHKTYGALLRVLDGLFESQPRDFAALVKKRHRFVTFFPLGLPLIEGYLQLLRMKKSLSKLGISPFFVRDWKIETERWRPGGSGMGKGNGALANSLRNKEHCRYLVQSMTPR